MTNLAWNQSINYVSKSTTPGWSWRCTELVINGAGKDVRPCTSTSYYRSRGFGLSSLSGALKGALAHRYQCHFRPTPGAADIWERINYHGHNYWGRVG